MALRRRGNVWWTEFRIKGVPYRRSTGFAERAKAEEFEARLKTELYDLRDIGRKREVRYGEIVKRYIENVTLTKARNRDGSIRRSPTNDIWRLTKLLDYFGRNALLASVARPAAIGQLNRFLCRTMQPTSANRFLSLHRAVLNKAYDWGALAQRPGLRLNREPRVANRAISGPQERQLLRIVPERIHDLAVCTLDTGIRREEAARLTWDDIDFRRRPRPILIVREAKNYDHRVIPLPKRTAKILAKRKRKFGRLSPMVFVYRAERDIFTNMGEHYARLGDVIPIGSFINMWKQVKHAMGLPGLRLHDLRHTYASKLVSWGVPLTTVAKLLGHRTVDSTGRYAYLAAQELDRAVGVLDRADRAKFRQARESDMKALAKLLALDRDTVA